MRHLIRRLLLFLAVALCFTRMNVSSANETLRLKDDDPQYNKKYSVWVPALQVPLANGALWGFDRYVADYSFSRISSDTIRRNFREGWVWDTDDFPTNYSLHPYLGSVYFNCARSNGYGFYSSMPFAFGGSLMWEYFMETTRPSYNDLVNTTVSGIFLGEVVYRLSSNVLDDRSTGGARVLREVAATVLDPARGFNRLVQGKMFRVVDAEVYQKEPLHFTLGVGARKTSRGPKAGSTSLTNALVSLNMAYGDPFESRSRKPFDYFNFNAELASGNFKDAAKDVIGEGFLFGGNPYLTHDWRMLIGGFQHYDYWNTDTFEIGTIGVGPGLLTEVPVSKKGFFRNELHIAGVPLGASNARKIVTGDPLNPGFKNYTYSGGGELKYETLLDFGYGSISGQYYVYWLHTFVGDPGDNFIQVFRPRITVKPFPHVGVGYEYFLYHRADTNGAGPTIRVRTHEQRLYLVFD